MAKKSNASPEKQKSLEAQLWDAANKMRGSVTPSDYMHVSLGLVFLRFLSVAFEKKHRELLDTPHASPEDPEEYTAENICWVPEEARWAFLAANARSTDIGKRLDAAMRAIERDNESLKGVLPKIYGKQDFDPTVLGGLIDQFTNLNLESGKDGLDVLGRVYEFFLGEFAAMQGKSGGEQYTPRCVVSLLVEMLEPLHGRIYDPCHGTGGFYIQSNRFVGAHAGKLADIAVYGQERNAETWRLARMNLALRGIAGDLRWNAEGTLLKDAFPDGRFDFVLANPPFNISDWSGHLLRDDARWKFGIPPLGSANFAWIQHIYHHLSPNGFGAVVMANGTMSSNSGGEGEIRKALIEGDAVDCMVSLPGQLFFGTQIPVCLWILARNKGGGKFNDRDLRKRNGEILFIDASKMGSMLSKVQRTLTDDDVQKIAGVYHSWRQKGGYQDVPGFSKSASLDDIRSHGHVLPPGRYVGAEEVEDDGDPFEEKMPRLVAELRSQFAESGNLERTIEINLTGLGYE